MHHRLRLVFGENAIECGAISDVANDQRRAGTQRGAMSVRQVIKHDRLVAAVEQLRDDHAANVACATGNQNSLRHASTALSLKPRSNANFRRQTKIATAGSPYCSMRLAFFGWV